MCLLTVLNTCTDAFLEPERFIRDTLVVTNDSIVGNEAFGTIVSIGDKIVEYGHTWSPTSAKPNIENNSTKDPKMVVNSNITRGTKITSTIGGITPGNKYFVWSYAIDENDYIYWGDSLEYTPVFNDFAVSFTHELDNPCVAPCVAKFTDTTNPGTETIIGWHWNFGDGNTSIERNPMHTFSLPDTFTVQLTVTTANELPRTIEQIVIIPASKIEKPILGFGIPVGVIQVDEDFIVMGNGTNSGGENDIYFLRIDRFGALVDNPIKDGTYNLNHGDNITAITPLSNGNIGVAGTTVDLTDEDKDFYYLEVSPTGNIQQGPYKFNRNQSDEEANNIIEVLGSSIAMVGKTTDSSGSSDVYLVWFSIVNGSPTFKFRVPIFNPGENENGYAVTYTPNSANINVENFFIAGTIGSPTDPILIKTNEQGVLVNDFPKRLPINENSLGTGFDNAFDIQLLSSGNLMFTGESFSSEANGNLYLIKTDKDGNRILPYPINMDINMELTSDKGNRLIELVDDTVMVAGFTNQNAALFKIAPSGSLLSGWEFGGPGTELFTSVSKTTDGGYVAVGWNGGTLYFVKTDQFGKSN